MSITGPGSVTAANITAVNNINTQLDKLSAELGSGQVAQTYSDLGSQAGLTLSLNAQLSALTGYSNTTTTVGTTLTLAQSVLTQLGSSSNAVEQSINQAASFTLDQNGKTQTQEAAAAQLDQILSALNSQAGDNYMFSGSAVNQPSVASASLILNGNGTQAGLTQVIQQRLQADEGSGTGRLTVAVGGGGTDVTVSQDGSPFGFTLGSVNSSLTNAVVTGPSGSPPSISVNLAGGDPNNNDTISFNLTLPDGSSQTITLTATSNSPPGANQFTIDPSTSVTATNLQTALNTAITNLVQTSMPAASAMAAANDFFQIPPQIVSGAPATSMSLTAGTTANTVFWYTGENGSTPARQTATAQVGPTTTVDYGMRASEPAITNLVANVAVLAATSYSATDPNAQGNYQALSQEVASNLDGKSGTQSIDDIEADLANAQTVVSNATTLNTQTQTNLQSMLQNIDGVNQNQVGEQILTLQNALSATLSVTARLSQVSLVNFLTPVSG
jgi:flagellar hook-associated protein 3 FlgL